MGKVVPSRGGQQSSEQPDRVPKQLRPSIRLGGGDFEWPDQTERPVARDFFLDAVNKLDPRVLADLAGEPLELSKHIQSQFGAGVLFCLSDDPMEWPDILSPLRESLTVWGQRYHLDQPWCLLRAVRTLSMWQYPGVPHDSWAHPPQEYWIPFTDDEMQVSFVSSGWNPLFERRVERQRKLEKAFKQYLRAKFDHLEEAALKRGLKKTKERRAPEQHFEWLAKAVVRRWPYSKIAKRTGRERQSVTEAIENLANLIDLPLPTYDPAG